MGRLANLSNPGQVSENHYVANLYVIHSWRNMLFLFDLHLTLEQIERSNRCKRRTPFTYFHFLAYILHIVTKCLKFKLRGSLKMQSDPTGKN